MSSHDCVQEVGSVPQKIRDGHQRTGKLGVVHAGRRSWTQNLCGSAYAPCGTINSKQREMVIQQ